MRSYFEGEKGVYVFRPISNFTKRGKRQMGLLVFSERRKLGAMFDKWAEENNVAKKPESVIAFLQIIGAIDAEKAREAIKNEEA